MRQRPHAFGGKGQSVGGWIYAMELFSRGTQTQDNMKVWVAESVLEGDAFNWYTSLDAEGGICDWSDFSHKLPVKYAGIFPESQGTSETASI